MASSLEYSALQWTKASARTYERSLDNMERFFSLAGHGGVGAKDGQHWHISIIGKVNTIDIDLKRSVTAAWKALRSLNPGLAAVVQGDRFVYTAADEEELNSWLQESLHFHETGKSSRELFPIRNLSGRAMLHVLLETQELYLLAPHSHLDGIGAYTALNNLLQAIVDNPSEHVTFGNEFERLSPPLDVLAEVPVATDETKGMFQSMLGRWIAGFEGVQLDPKDIKQRCKEPRILYAPFDAADTAGIVARCKELGFSVTAAVQAAVSTALRKQVRHTGDMQSVVTIHNVRKWIDKSKNPATSLVGPMTIPVPAVLSLTDDFVETASMMKQKYLEPEQTPFLRSLPSFWGNEMVSIITSSPPPGMSAPSSLGLSSFGVMDAHVRSSYAGASGGRLELEDAWLGITLYSPDILLHLWTLQGTMRLQCVYNEAYHDEVAVSALLAGTKDELMQGLSLR